jgi:hypothetical protein
MVTGVLPRRHSGGVMSGAVRVVNPMATLSRGLRPQTMNAGAISLDDSNFKGFGNRGGFQFVNDE